jgi:hypothetical protein
MGCGPETLGKLAEKNSKALGGQREVLLQKMANDRAATVGEFKGKIPEGADASTRPKKSVPWFRKDKPDGPDMKLNTLSDKQKTDFILDGKRPIGI